MPWFWLIVATLLVPFVRTTASVGMDFVVAHRTAQALWHGGALYDVERYGFMVFKYPPWLISPYLPLGLLPLDTARWIWGFLTAWCVVYSLRHMLKLNVRPWIILVVFVAYAGLWMNQAFLGQLSVIMLAAVLWIDVRMDSSRRFALGAFVLSAKILTVFPLLAWIVSQIKGYWARPQQIGRPLLLTATICITLSLPPLFMAKEGSDPLNLLRAWHHAIASGGAQVAADATTLQTLGREVQGIPALIARIVDVHPANSSAMTWLSLLSMLVLGSIWMRFSNPRHRWLGLVALTPVVQPLAWFHSFVLAFPLQTLLFEEQWRERQWKRLSTLSVAILLTAAITEKTCGHLGFLLELASVKSWGVLLTLALCLKQASRQSTTHHSPRPL